MGTTFCKGLKPGLYAITDSDLLPGSNLVPAVEAALRGGAVLVQYREKKAGMAERLRQASNLVAACRNAGVPLVINDDPELAQRTGAAGVHLGQSDHSASVARRLLGDQAIIGITCHDDIRLAQQARDEGADYLAFGRFFHSTTKSQAPPADPGILTRAKELNLPVTAIGGISPANGAALVQAGADLLAVIGGLFGGSLGEVEERAQLFTRLFASHHPLFTFHETQES